MYSGDDVRSGSIFLQGAAYAHVVVGSSARDVGREEDTEFGAPAPRNPKSWEFRRRVIRPISGESEKLGRKFRRQLLWKATRRSAEFSFAAGCRLEESSGRERRQELGHQADVCGADFSHISGRWAESTIRKSESPESGTSGENNREDLQPCGAALFAAGCPFPGEIRTQGGTGISGFRLAIRGGDFVGRSPRKLADIRFVCIIAIPPETSPESGKSDPGVSATPRRLVRRLV